MTFLLMLIITIIWVGAIWLLLSILPTFLAICIIFAFSVWVWIWADNALKGD